MYVGCVTLGNRCHDVVYVLDTVAQLCSGMNTLGHEGRETQKYSGKNWLGGERRSAVHCCRMYVEYSTEVDIGREVKEEE